MHKRKPFHIWISNKTLGEYYKNYDLINLKNLNNNVKNDKKNIIKETFQSPKQVHLISLQTLKHPNK